MTPSIRFFNRILFEDGVRIDAAESERVDPRAARRIGSVVQGRVSVFTYKGVLSRFNAGLGSSQLIVGGKTRW